MIRLAITGPESSGKTRLASDLAKHFNVDFVPEYARGYLLSLQQPYKRDDLDVIADGQWNSIEKAGGNNPLICDTEMVVLYTWSMVKYGSVSNYIERKLAAQQFDLYILCDIDIPWEYDALREHEHDREELFHRYYKKLRQMHANFILVKGNPQERVDQALLAINSFVNKSKLL